MVGYMGPGHGMNNKERSFEAVRPRSAAGRSHLRGFIQKACDDLLP